MLGDLLHRLNSEGLLTVSDIARIWRVLPHSVYPYLQDRWPTLDRYLDLIERSDPAVQAELLGYVLSSARGWLLVRMDPAVDPQNGDEVDVDEVLAMALDQVEGVAATARATHEATRDRRLTSQEIEKLMAASDEALAAMVRYQRALIYLKRHLPTRRKARPVLAGEEVAHGA